MNPSASTVDHALSAAAAAELSAAAGGDRDALAAIVDAYHGDMVRVAHVICGDVEITADAVQSAWLKIATSLGSVREPSRLRAWLCSVAANEARQARRRRRPTVSLDAIAGAHAEASDRSAEFVDMTIAVNRLATRDRELLALRYVAGFSSAELADHFDLTAAGVRSRLKRLLDRLRMELNL